MDWTDFDADNQATIMLALISDHGRSTPLVWLTVDKRTLKTTARSMSTACWCGSPNWCQRASRCASLPIAALVIKKLYQMLAEELYFDFVILLSWQHNRDCRQW